MLPFLKNKDEGGTSAPVSSVKRKPDEDASFDMLDAVAEDMLAAYEKKDKERLKAALGALCDYIRMEDIEQDQEDLF